ELVPAGNSAAASAVGMSPVQAKPSSGTSSAASSSGTAVLAVSIRRHRKVRLLTTAALALAAITVAGILFYGRRTRALTEKDSIVLDRKSTRLNSSHRTISYAVFC